MFFLKSTTPPMAIGQLAKICSTLVKQKHYHTAEMLHYARLFNSSQPDIVTLEVSSLQDFYQLQAEFHQAELIKINFAINELEQVA